MSLQVWCYECDEYVEGWELLDQIKEKLDELDFDIEIKIENTPTNSNRFKSRNSGTGNKNVKYNNYDNLIIVGLYNSGNSCFINAALQILLNCPSLMGFFHDNCKSFVVSRDKSGQSSNQPSISEQFMSLIDAVHNPEW